MSNVNNNSNNNGIVNSSINGAIVGTGVGAAAYGARYYTKNPYAKEEIDKFVSKLCDKDKAYEVSKKAAEIFKSIKDAKNLDEVKLILSDNAKKIKKNSTFDGILDKTLNAKDAVEDFCSNKNLNDIKKIIESKSEKLGKSMEETVKQTKSGFLRYYDEAKGALKEIVESNTPQKEIYKKFKGVAGEIKSASAKKFALIVGVGAGILAMGYSYFKKN